MNALAELVQTQGCLLVDGAMGTELFAAGLGAGDPPEFWNVEEPDKVANIHRRYVDAGSDIFLTNTFGGNCFRLKLHNAQDRVHELNAAAATIGRGVADSTDRQVLVAGSMGPSGELLEPMGQMTPETCQAAFADQAAGLTDGGADLLWIETMSSLDEVRYAVLGAQSVSELPIVVTMSFDTAGRTMMGVTGTDAATALIELGVAAMGVNCGNNLADSEAAIAQMRAVDPGIILVSKANAGIPVWEGSNLTYSGTPEVMSAHAHRVRGVGASVVGACCGSSPDHLKFMRAVLDGEVDVPAVVIDEASTPRGGASTDAASDATAEPRPRRRRRRG